MQSAPKQLVGFIIFLTIFSIIKAYPIPFTVVHEVGLKTTSAQRQGKKLILNFTVSSEQFISWGNQTTYGNGTNVWPLQMSSSVEKYCQNIPLSQNQKYSFTFYDYFDFTCPSSLYFMTKTETVPVRILEIYIGSTVQQKDDNQLTDKLMQEQESNLKSE